MERTARSRGATWIGTAFGVTPSEAPRLLGLMGLFFLVVCAVGMLRPIKNSLALDGLGAGDFYQVYLVSAAVVAFVPLFNRLADVLPWRMLFAVVAGFFGLNLIAFRLAYVEGSAVFGLAFYGWYDLFAAALVTQFFMATQFYFDARSARRAYPLVIAGGSIGATLGGAMTGLLAQRVGTANLLLGAAALILVFAFCIPLVLRTPVERPRPGTTAAAQRGTVRELFAHRQVRLIAAAVLVTVIVKQLVDYQFNAISKDVYVTLDAVSAFQGRFNAATQWLPLVVLVGLRPALRRWGIGFAVLLLPVFMLAATAALAVTFSLAAAIAAKGAETSLRYSAERAGREILYVPVPDAIKLRAKAYIDVAVEKGLGKVSAALLIMALLPFVGYRNLAWVSLLMAALWLALAVAVRREYVRTLAGAIEGRFASLRGVFASMVDASTLPALRDTLAHPSPLRVAFGLELVEQLPAHDIRTVARELNALVDHEREQIRAAALTQLTRAPDSIDRNRVRRRLLDPAPEVRAAAVHALLAAADDEAPALLNELLRHERSDVRSAALAAVLGGASPVANGSAAALRDAGRAWLEIQRTQVANDAEGRAELALAAGALRQDEADGLIGPFLDDADERVRNAALRSAGALRRFDERMIVALGNARTRDAAREALAQVGEAAIPRLGSVLMDTDADPRVRRAVPGVLARIPTQQTIDAMLRLVLAPETDQLLDYRTIRALGKLRSRHPGLRFDAVLVDEVADAECDAAARYAAALPAVRTAARDGDAAARVAGLLARALEEGWDERRESVFRCLGLLHDPVAMHRAHDALARGDASARANALEWVEQTIGVPRFRRLAAVLEPGGLRRVPRDAASLRTDSDSWIALLARFLTNPGEQPMELIEKVFLLQQIDLLRDARTAHVALLAAIADELEVPAGTVLIQAGAVPDSLYVITSGSVELYGVGGRVVVGEEQAFGTWALIDDQPGHVEARALEPTRLLRVTRGDFHDLLGDHPELGIGMLRGLAQRMRSVVA